MMLYQVITVAYKFWKTKSPPRIFQTL